MNPTSNIYVTHYVEDRFDLNPALDYLSGDGEIKIIMRGQVNPFNLSQAVTKIKEEVQTFTEDDWLILSGNIVISSLVTAIVSEKFPVLNLLIWDSRKRDYIARRILTRPNKTKK